MITSIDYDTLIIRVREQLIEQTGISGDRILNAASVRGADLTEILNNTDVLSIKLTDVFMTFDVVEQENEDNVIIPEEDDTMTALATYNFILKIYGNMCHMCAQQIRALFKTSEVATTLRNAGVYIKGIEFPIDQKEFINNTLWPRCDLTLQLQCRHNFEKTTSDGYFDEKYQSKDVEFVITKIQ